MNTQERLRQKRLEQERKIKERKEAERKRLEAKRLRLEQETTINDATAPTPAEGVEEITDTFSDTKEKVEDEADNIKEHVSKAVESVKEETEEVFRTYKDFPDVMKQKPRYFSFDDEDTGYTLFRKIKLYDKDMHEIDTSEINDFIKQSKQSIRESNLRQYSGSDYSSTEIIGGVVKFMIGTGILIFLVQAIFMPMFDAIQSGALNSGAMNTTSHTDSALEYIFSPFMVLFLAIPMMLFFISIAFLSGGNEF